MQLEELAAGEMRNETDNLEHLRLTVTPYPKSLNTDVALSDVVKDSAKSIDHHSRI